MTAWKAFLDGMSQTFGVAQVRRYVPPITEGMAAAVEDVRAAARTAHAQLFADLPLLPHGIELPTHDGDVAELEELADRILATALPDIEEDYAGWWDGYRILEFASWTGISFRMDPWPEDEAAALIEAWKAGS